MASSSDDTGKNTRPFMGSSLAGPKNHGDIPRLYFVVGCWDVCELSVVICALHVV
jgi:hypothetical protein